MKLSKLIPVAVLTASLAFGGCGNKGQEGDKTQVAEADSFQYIAEMFADDKVLRYQIPGFDKLSLKQKEMLYYLSQAALAGRDIYWDQGYKHNLCVRRTLEGIINNFKGEKNADYDKFLVYAKRVFFANGIHHQYAETKILPECSKEYFATLVKGTDAKNLPLNEGETVDAFIARITPIMFDPKIAPKKVNKDKGVDMVAASAGNFYEGVTQKEVEEFYKKMEVKGDSTPIWYGLNSKVVKENGNLVEKKWFVGGMYGKAIEKIVYWLEKAAGVAENDRQRAILMKLVEYYKTGDLKKFDEYNILWVQETESLIDVVNGFIEVYDDPIGKKGSYESTVSFKDVATTERIAKIAAEAQWFEDNSTIMKEHKKAKVKGITAKVITVVMEAGDAAPTTPIGINLPNADWIRAKHGSKSVNLGNIVDAYDNSSTPGLLKEFAYSDEEVARAKKHASLADKLHTDMHEAIGHASGQINPGIGSPKETLKNYASTLEEARADLVALYFLMDKKLIDMKLMESLEVGKAEYDKYIRNGLLMQLTRLKMGENLEEDHMRNRQLIAAWAFEKGKKDNVIEKKTKDGKTFFVVNDYEKLRVLFGELLKEIQRIKSEGDFEAGKALVETYGVKVDQALLKEALERYAKFKDAPYRGFIQPKLVPVMEGDKIKDVKVEYPKDFLQQMLEYGKEHSFLPTYN